MNAARFRKYLPKLEEELVLNVCYGADEDYHVLAMVARKKGRLYMWEISTASEEENERKMRRLRINRTNREKHKESFRGSAPKFIREIVINGQELCVSSATGSCVGENWNDDKKVLLFYFLLKGVKLGALEQMPFEKLCINEYKVYEKENGGPYDDKEPEVLWSFPAESENIAVAVHTDTQHIPTPVHKRLTLKPGEYKKPRTVELPGDEDAEIYISGVTMYDAWEQEKTRFDDPRYKQFSEGQIREMKEMHLKALEATCPKGYVIPLIEYECNRDYQVQFYTSDYLRRKHVSSNSSTIMMFSSDKKTGPMGLRNRACALEAVPADYAESLSVELFMYYKIIPGKTINCESIQ